MKIAVPTAQGKLCLHFGHCEVFTFFDVDENKKVILKSEEIVPPEHAPGVIPNWVAEQKANLVLAGGMGAHAQDLFVEHGVKVLTGCSAIEPEEVVKSFLNNSLVQGENTCDH